MAFFVLNGTAYDVDASNCTEDAPDIVGEADRSFNNNLRSSKRDPKPNMTVTLPFLTTAEFAALRAANPEGAFVPLTGDIVGNVAQTVEVTYPSIPFNQHLTTFKRSPQLHLRFV